MIFLDIIMAADMLQHVPVIVFRSGARRKWVCTLRVRPPATQPKRSKKGIEYDFLCSLTQLSYESASRYKKTLLAGLGCLVDTSGNHLFEFIMYIQWGVIIITFREEKKERSECKQQNVVAPTFLLNVNVNRVFKRQASWRQTIFVQFFNSMPGPAIRFPCPAPRVLFRFNWIHCEHRMDRDIGVTSNFHVGAGAL